MAAIDVVVPFIENFGDDVELEDQFAASLMLRHGIPEDVVTALRSVSRSFRAWGARADVTRPLHDGEELRFATAPSRCSTGRDTAHRTPCSGTPSGGSCSAPTT